MSNGGETAEILQDVGKAHLSDNLRLMADNQRILNASNADDRRRRDLQARTEEAMAKSRFPNLAEAKELPEEDMKILVDSPTTTTVNHYHQAETKSVAEAKPDLPPKAEPKQATSSPLRKAAMVAALLGSGVGVGAAIPWAMGMLGGSPAADVIAPADAETQYEVRIEVE